MSELKSILDLFNKNTINNIEKYFFLIIDLYIKPIKSWKRIINQRKSSFTNFIIYLLFFLLISFIIYWDLRSAILYVLVHLLFTILPFLVLLLPFKVFVLKNKKRININRLYRLFFIFNIQLFPFIHFPVLISKWSNTEFLYIFSDYVLILFDLLVILVIPILLKIKTSQKVLWILCNYFFMTFYLLGFNKALTISEDFRVLVNKVEYYAPKDEFYELQRKYNKSDLYLINNQICIYSKKRDTLYDISVQFNTLYTSNYIFGTINERLNKITLQHLQRNEIESLNSKNPFEIYNRIYYRYLEDSTSLTFDFKPLSLQELKKLDSLRLSFNKDYYEDIELMDSLRFKAIFASNREYADYVYNYLKQYDVISQDSIKLTNLINSKNAIGSLIFNDSTDLAIFHLDESYISYELQGIIDRNNKLNKRYETPNFFAKIFYYPLFKILNLITSQYDYTNQFEYLNFREN